MLPLTYKHSGMEETLNILLPYGYYINEADVQTGKNYVLRRESTVRGISSLIDALLKDAAREITMLCYQYDVDPMTFQMTQKYNEKLFDEIARILDDLEEEILDLVLDYSTRCTESEKRKSALLPWIVLLGRDNRNLRQTLERRLLMFSRDLEAAVVAVRMAKKSVTRAVTSIVSNLHTVYNMPEMNAAFKKSAVIKSKNVRTKGVKAGNVGNSNSEANNILRFARTTVQMTWMRNQRMNFEDRGAVGFYVLRGSNYTCDLCDSKVGFHFIDDTDSYPPYHSNCMCWTIPVYQTTNI